MNSDLTRFLKEDYGRGDVTSELLFPTNLKTKAVIMTRETGIIAGCLIINELFQELDLITDWYFSKLFLGFSPFRNILIRWEL